MHIKKKITDIYGRRDIHPEEARSRQLTYGFPLNELALSTEVSLFPLQLTHVLSSCLVVLRVIILTRYKFSSSQLYFLRALIFVLYRALPIGLIVQVIDPCLFFPVFNQNPSQNSPENSVSGNICCCQETNFCCVCENGFPWSAISSSNAREAAWERACHGPSSSVCLYTHLTLPTN